MATTNPRDELHARIAAALEEKLRQQRILREVLDPARQAAQLADSVTALFDRVYHGNRTNLPVLAAYTAPRAGGTPR